MLEEWLQSYRPRSSSMATAACAGARRARARRRSPHGRESARERRPAARDAAMPDFREYAVDVPAPGADRRPKPRACSAIFARHHEGEAARRNFRAVRAGRNGIQPAARVFEATDRVWMARSCRRRTRSAPDGRVMEVLSEHMCQGWLEGYLLTGRHGFFSCYEAFIHIIDSMFNQHAKWLKTTRHIPWRGRSRR